MRGYRLRIKCYFNFYCICIFTNIFSLTSRRYLLNRDRILDSTFVSIDNKRADNTRHNQSEMWHSKLSGDERALVSFRVVFVCTTVTQASNLKLARPFSRHPLLPYVTRLRRITLHTLRKYKYLCTTFLKTVLTQF